MRNTDDERGRPRNGEAPPPGAGDGALELHHQATNRLADPPSQEEPTAADQHEAQGHNHHTTVITDWSRPPFGPAPAHDSPTFYWQCTCGARSLLAHHQTEARAELAARWHAYNQHGGPTPNGGQR